MSRLAGATILSLVLIAGCGPAASAAPKAAPVKLETCWQKQVGDGSSDQPFVERTGTWLCLKDSGSFTYESYERVPGSSLAGKVQSGDYRVGRGWRGRNLLTLTFSGDKEEHCLFRLNRKRKALRLTSCRLAGIWRTE